MEIDEPAAIAGLVLATALATVVVAAATKVGIRAHRRRTIADLGRAVDLRAKLRDARGTREDVLWAIDSEIIEMQRELDPFHPSRDAVRHDISGDPWTMPPPPHRSRWRRRLDLLWANLRHRWVPLVVALGGLTAILLTNAYSTRWAGALADAITVALTVGIAFGQAQTEDMRTDRRREDRHSRKQRQLAWQRQQKARQEHRGEPIQTTREPARRPAVPVPEGLKRALRQRARERSTPPPASADDG